MIKDIYDTKINLKGVKRGIDVSNIVSPDLEKLRQLDKNTIRTYKIGTVTITSYTTDMVFSSYTGTAVVDHDLGYVPYCMAFYKNSTNGQYRSIPDYTFSVTGGGFQGDQRFNIYVTDKRITFEVFGTALIVPDVPITIKYYLFRERIV